MLVLQEQSDALLSMEEDSDELVCHAAVVILAMRDEEVLVVSTITTGSSGIRLDALGGIIDVTLVLKSVTTTASMIVELEITEVSMVVNVAVGTRHSTVPDC